MADHSKPALAGTSYPDFRDQLMARIDDALRSLDPAVTSPTNIPTGSVRWSSAAKKWQIWSGTAWGDLAAEYAISISGSAATLKTARTIALSGGATGTATSFNGSTNITIPVTALDASKLDGDIAWARVSANAPATATRWPAFSEVTGKPAAYPTTWGDVSGKPAFGDAALADVDDLQWLGTPVGAFITPASPPPTNDPRFRYIICSAGQSGSGGYNEGVLTDESVTGSAPLIQAGATVSLAGSPFNGQYVRLINTEGRFIGAGTSELVEDDMMQTIEGVATVRGATSQDTTFSGAFSGSYTQNDQNWLGSSSSLSQYVLNFNSANSYGARTGNRTQPRALRLVHYRRIK